MDRKESERRFKANNAEELLVGLKNKESHIIIQEGLKKEFLKNTELPLTENEEMGSHLGSGGGTAIGGGLLFSLINLLSKDSKQQKQIDSKMRSYKVKKWNKNGLLLYLRQLDY